MQFLNILPSNKKDWTVQFDSLILTELFAFRTYNSALFKDLLRFIHSQQKESLSPNGPAISNDLWRNSRCIFEVFYQQISQIISLFVCCHFQRSKMLDSTFKENYLG